MTEYDTGRPSRRDAGDGSEGRRWPVVADKDSLNLLRYLAGGMDGRALVAVADALGVMPPACPGADADAWAIVVCRAHGLGAAVNTAGGLWWILDRRSVGPAA